MLSIKGLKKSYNNHEVLKGVDLTVAPGEIVGLIGVNGAGKSTLTSIVAGLRSADEGCVTICGVDALKDPHASHTHLGLVAQEIGLYPILTGWQNLDFFGRLVALRSQSRKRRIEEVADSLGLTDFLHNPVETLSGGQRRRLHTAVAMLHRPSVLLLDEPTVGADIQSRQKLLDEVRRFAAEGSAVVYATHYFPEVETLGASVAILHEGRIVARGDSYSIINLHAAPSVELAFEGEIPTNLSEFAKIGDQGNDEGQILSRVVIPVRHPGRDLAGIITNLGIEASRLRSVEFHQPSLETAFLRITGRKNTDLEEEEINAVLQ
ncbi:MAG: ABC transporter ATP-binding protein [Terracidiphilus sp.]